MLQFFVRLFIYSYKNNIKTFWYYYCSVMKLYTFFILVVLSSLPSIFSALLEDSLFWSYFSRFRVSAQRLEDCIWSICARSWDSRADIDIKRSSRTPLRLSRVPVQGPSTWVNLRYLEYLRKGLNQRSS